MGGESIDIVAWFPCLYPQVKCTLWLILFYSGSFSARFQIIPWCAESFSLDWQKESLWDVCRGSSLVPEIAKSSVRFLFRASIASSLNSVLSKWEVLNERVDTLIWSGNIAASPIDLWSSWEMPSCRHESFNESSTCFVEFRKYSPSSSSRAESYIDWLLSARAALLWAPLGILAEMPPMVVEDWDLFSESSACKRVFLISWSE